MNSSVAKIKDHTISIYVANKPGVLARIAQVFSRRGFNIDSLVVSPSVDGRYSRMTVAAKGSTEGLEQVILQVSKLVDVMHCIDHSSGNAIVREMALVKMLVNSEQRTEVLQICEHFGCKTVDLTTNAMTAMIMGNSEKLDACINMLQQFEIIELVRTGKVVMARGDEVT
jgi:acetolactate synthase-1/3 small subunit